MTNKADRRIRDKTINRFEVIDETGRVIVKYGVSVELLYTKTMVVDFESGL